MIYLRLISKFGVLVTGYEFHSVTLALFPVVVRLRNGHKVRSWLKTQLFLSQVRQQCNQLIHTRPSWYDASQVNKNKHFRYTGVEWRRRRRHTVRNLSANKLKWKTKSNRIGENLIENSLIHIFDLLSLCTCCLQNRSVLSVIKSVCTTSNNRQT